MLGGAGEGFEALTEVQQQKVATMNTNLETFMNADRYVFVTPMWNFSYPPVVKAYLDNVAIAGKTFKYTENGPVGLLEGKKHFTFKQQVAYILKAYAL